MNLLSFRERKKQRNPFEIATHVMVFFAQAIDFSTFMHSAHMLKSKRAPSLPDAVPPAISTAFAQE